MQGGEFCPNVSCNGDDRGKVLDSRIALSSIGPIRRRRKVCPACGTKWLTIEILIPEDLPLDIQWR